MSTESELENWRHGPILAERLCAEILALEGFTNIDPQAPLGGPDDKKDILARRDGLLWVAAVSFPPTSQPFASVREKFESDLEGVARAGGEAFAFFVNQRLTLGERDELRRSTELPVEVFHLERLRAILDAPGGYGLRLQFLHIQMTAEEQASFVLALQEGMNARMRASETELSRMHEKVDEVLARTTILGGLPPQQRSSVTAEPAPTQIREPPTSALTVETLIFIHRLVAPDSLFPGLLSDDLRPVNVQIGDPDNPVFIPPGPAEVPARVAEYVAWWRTLYPTLVEADRDLVIEALAELHHRFLSIHPFLDGNGRVARAILDQAARELLGESVEPALTADAREYFMSLRAADDGDLTPLRALIRNSLR